MNIKNNQRHKETINGIDAAFVSLLNEKELNDISVSELCERAEINRSTFYENYADVFALANAYAEKIENQIADQPHTDDEFAWIFDYIKTNVDVFEIYFKLGISKKSADYKELFFRNGVYAVAKMWFEGGCVESPEQMGEIIKREYKKAFGAY